MLIRVYFRRAISYANVLHKEMRRILKNETPYADEMAVK